MDERERFWEFHNGYAETKRLIIDGLRRAGWSREDANEEADIREARDYAKWLKRFPPAPATGDTHD